MLPPDPSASVGPPKHWPRTNRAKEAWRELERRRIAEGETWFVLYNQHGSLLAKVPGAERRESLVVYPDDGDPWSVTVEELADLLGIPATAPRSRREPSESTPALPVPEDPLDAYLERLVHRPKAVYATAYAAHLLNGAPRPSDPLASWAPKVREKVARYVFERQEAAA
jgi:hypothetical protein